MAAQRYAKYNLTTRAHTTLFFFLFTYNFRPKRSRCFAPHSNLNYFFPLYFSHYTPKILRKNWLFVFQSHLNVHASSGSLQFEKKIILIHKNSNFFSLKIQMFFHTRCTRANCTKTQLELQILFEYHTPYIPLVRVILFCVFRKVEKFQYSLFRTP